MALFVLPAGAQLPPDVIAGSTIQVSTVPIAAPVNPRVDSDSTGNFLISWIRNQTGEIVFRRFDSRGLAVDASERTVVTAHLSALVDLDVAVGAGGASVFAWRENQGLSQGNVSARLYRADGEPGGPAFDVSQQTARQWTLDAAMDASGAIAIIWRATGEDGGTFLATFDAEGLPRAEDVLLDQGARTADTSQQPDVAFANDGHVIAAWDVRTGSPLPDRKVKVARLDFGTGLGSPIQPHSVVFDDQRQPLLAPLADGGFVLVWNQIVRFGTDPDWSLVHAQRLGPGGELLGDVLELGAFYSTSVAGLPDGGFVVAGDGTPADNDRAGLLAQIFDAVGEPRGPRFWVENDPALTDARVAATASGFVTVWKDAAAPGVFARLYDVEASGTEIEVLAPDSGDTLIRETFRDITWSAPTITGRVMIDLTRDGGFTWETLKTATDNDGLWSWRVQGAPTLTARVRITSLDDPAITSESRGFFTIPTPQVVVHAPQGDERWPIHVLHDVRWSMTNIDGPARIEFSRDDGASWQLIAAQTPNDGLLRWWGEGPPSDDARFRVSSYWDPDVAETSASPFVIPEPQVTVLSPNGGESLPVDAFVEITWSLVDLGGPVAVELSRDGGLTWEVLDDETPNDGRWNGLIGGPATLEARVRVRSFNNPQYSDQSDQLFELAAP